jgi:mono/diheme cytochrome c family protein
MRNRIQPGLAAAIILLGAHGMAQAAGPATARSIVAEHCIECHRVPGFAEEARNPDIKAPDFQVIADDRKTYTTQRLVRFLRKPHFPMREFVFSESDIQNLVAFIEGLRTGPEGAQ